METESLLELLIDVTIKASVITLIALVAAIVLRRSAASLRNAIWSAAIIALLALPVLSASLPRWEVLPRWAVAEQEADTDEIVLAAEEVVEFPAANLESEPVAAGEVAVANNAQSPDSGRIATAVRDHKQMEPVVVATVTQGSGWSLAGTLVLAWVAGVLLLLLRLALSRIALAKLECKATESRELLDAFEDARSRLGLRRGIRLRLSDSRTVPMTWGVLRPVVLLPACAVDWSRDRIGAVMLHELGHVRRGDSMMRLLSQLAMALHWFNPLAWLAARQLDSSCEDACDDLVLAHGQLASDYAEHLLAILANLKLRPRAAALSMASPRRGALKTRLRKILAPNAQRQSLRRRTVLALLSLALSACIPVAMLRAAVDDPTEDESDTNEAVEEDDEATLWGEPVRGLQAGLVINRNQEFLRVAASWDLFGPSDWRTGFMSGEDVGVELLIRNVSELPITLTKSGGVFPTGTATDPSGKVQELAGFKHKGKPFVDHYEIAPDEVLRLKAIGFQIATADYKFYTPRLSAKLVAEPNVKQTISYTFSNKGIESKGDDDWVGELRTGKLTAVIPELRKTTEKLNKKIMVHLKHPAPEAPPEADERKILWGEPADGFCAGLIAGEEEVLEHRIGDWIGGTCVIRNVSKNEQTIQWRERVSKRGTWFVTDKEGKSTGARDSFRRSWELRNPIHDVVVPPGHEFIVGAGAFAVTELGNHGFSTPSAAVGPGLFDEHYHIMVAHGEKPKYASLPTGKMKIKIAPRLPHPTIGKRAENFQLAMDDGSTFELARSRGKDVVVLYFWGSRNYRSHGGWNFVSSVSEKLKGKGARVIGVNKSDSLEEARKWMQSKGAKFELGLDRDGGAHHLFTADGPRSPLIVIIGKDGVVRKTLTFIPYPDRLEAAIKEWL